MAASIDLTEQADDDLTEAGDWCEKDRPGRGAKFLARVADTFAAIGRSPGSFTPHARGYRRLRVRHFPYVVVYKYDAATNVVTVHAVWHTSRDPNDLLRRLP